MGKLLKSKFFLGAMVVIVILVGFAVASTASADCTIIPTLRVGSHGANVMCVQTIVGATVDGSFGPLTKAAVMAWQLGHSLVADGVVGPLTAATMNSMVSVSYPAGCTSATGYSITTGQPCNSGGNFPAGCTSTTGYSVTTGLPCTTTGNFPAGCTSTIGYSPTTGVKCDSTVITPTGHSAGGTGNINSTTYSVVEITAESSDTQYVDAAPAIKEGIDKLTNSGGGTLFFGPGRYFISKTIELPSNITIQCVGSGDVGPCMIILGTNGNMNAQGMALFSILPGTKNLIMRDMELRSMTPGWKVYPRYDISRIKDEKTTAIRMMATNSAPISDIQFENLRITNFTYGIEAGSSTGNDAIIKNVKIRSISSAVNYLALWVNSLNATNWDVQGFNIVEMGAEQNGVLLERAGKMAFSNLSFASTLHNANLGLDIRQHSGPLYFRMLHVEGPQEGIRVRATSKQPIYFESIGHINGSVEAESTLYSFSNSYPLNEQGRLHFVGQGANSTLYACGDVFTTGYPTETQIGLSYPGLIHQPQGCNFDVTKVSNSFSTGALPFTLFNWLSSNSRASTNVLNIKSFGAKGDGVTDDTEAIKNALKDVPGEWSRSILLFPAGRYRISDTLNLKEGTILQGEPGTIIEFRAVNRPLFQIHVLRSDTILKRSIHFRDLIIRSMTPNPKTQNTTAIEFSGNAGASGDHAFYNLQISGFTRAFYIRNDSGVFNSDQPQVDSVAVRDMVLTNNYIGIEFKDQNASNWIFENIRVTKMQPDAKGVVINGGGFLSFSGLRCEGEFGTEGSRADACLSIARHTGIYVERLTTKNMKYALRAEWPIGWTPGTVSIRDSDLTAGVYVAGKIYLLSVSNLFALPSTSNTGGTQLGSRSTYFNVYGSDDPLNIYPGDESRITSCGDRFVNSLTLQFVGLKQSPIVCLDTPLSSTLTITTPSSLPNAKLGASYSTTISATGGTGSYSWTLASGSLPDGLSLTSVVCAIAPCQPSATISGTPTKVGTFNFTLGVSSSSLGDSIPVVTKSFTLEVNAEKPSTTTDSLVDGEVLGAESFHFTQLLKRGSSGNEVIELQKFLNRADYGTLITDGNFGPMTEVAVIKFQLANELVGDGVVGPLTRAFLNN